MSDSKIKYDSSSSVSAQLLYTVFQEPAVIHESEDGIEVTGYSGIYLYGLMGAGKTTDIIKLFERVCMYQEPYDGKRQIHIGVIRNSNADFVNTIGKSFSYWYKEQEKDGFRYGFKIGNAHTRPEVLVRFPSERPVIQSDGSVKMELEGIDCEIIYFCHAADKKGDIDKMKGGEYTCVWLNEGNLLLEEVHDMGTSRSDRYPPTGATRAFWIMDANPKYKNSWEYRKLVNPGDRNIKVIKYPSPLKFVPDKSGQFVFKGRQGRWDIDRSVKIHRYRRGAPDYSYWIKMLSKSDTFIQNNVLGEYADVREGEVVHDGYDPELHVGKRNTEVQHYWTLMVNVDFGLKCGATVMIQNDEGEIRVINGFWTDRGFNSLYKRIRSWLMNRYPVHWQHKQVLWIGDPRTGRKRDLVNASTSLDLILKDFPEDNYVVPARPDGAIVDDIDYRIQTVDEYLKYRNGFVIDPDCDELVKDAFAFGYVRDERTGKPDKIKSGKYAEIMDSIQYGLTYIALGGDTSTGYAVSGGSSIHHAY